MEDLQMHDDTGKAHPRKKSNKKDRKRKDFDGNYEQDKVKDFKRRKKTYEEDDDEWMEYVEKYN